MRTCVVCGKEPATEGGEEYIQILRKSKVQSQISGDKLVASFYVCMDCFEESAGREWIPEMDPVSMYKEAKKTLKELMMDKIQKDHNDRLDAEMYGYFKSKNK